MIETNWSDGIGNGKKAMIEAVKHYKSNKNDDTVMMNITNYNESDCKVVCEIVHYLRSNHITKVVSPTN